MTIYYFSPAYLIYNATTVFTVFALILLFRRRSRRAQDLVLLSLMGANVIQHLFKSALYPHLRGTGFGLINTAYNVCAFLILATPAVFFSKNNLLKQFFAYTGAAGGFAPLLFPSWFLGQSVFQWEFFRSWICHTLLAATSLLPALWGRITFRFCDGWKFGILFLLTEAAVFLDNVIFVSAGLYPAGAGLSLTQCLERLNPLCIVRPSEGYAASPLFKLLSPLSLLGQNGGFLPVIWNLFPLYAGITLLGAVLGGLFGHVQTRRRKPRTDAFFLPNPAPRTRKRRIFYKKRRFAVDGKPQKRYNTA